MTENDEKYEQIVMEIIANSGDAKEKAFEALKLAREKKFDEARAKMAESRKIAVKSHDVQTDMIVAEMDPEKEKTPVSLLMVHAQDHCMTSALARDLIAEMIDILEDWSKK